MQSLKIFITLCFIAALSNPVNAQQLWSGTVYGMSESTIKTIFPKVIEVKSNNPDISSVYELNEVELEGDTFTVRFFFKREKLIRVVLSSRQIKDMYWILQKTNRLEELLTYNYGTPYKSDDKTQRTTHKYKSVHWKNGKTEITLSMYEPLPDSKIKIEPIAIIYNADFLDAASKL